MQTGFLQLQNLQERLLHIRMTAQETADYIPSGLALAILGTNDDSSLGEINEFNSQNQIVVTYTGENTIQFSYNGDGIRVGKNVNGSIEKYLYDTGNHVVLEVDGDGSHHVSVYPVGGKMSDWVKAGSSSIWTKAVKSVTVKWDGVS